MTEMWWVILGGGLLTYLTRIAGHLAVARMETIPPRLEAALNAVPAAVLTTIFVPAFVDGTWVERVVLAASGLLSLRLPALVVITLAALSVAVARAYGL